MSGLPDRPDLDQLRRQARELLRAAADGEPYAVGRLRAVSPRVTLSAAQLALAREYGFPSWAALKAEVARRRSPATWENRWSFGGATALQISAGVLRPEILIGGASQAVLHGSLTLSGNGEPEGAVPLRRLPPWGVLLARLVPRRNSRATRNRRAEARTVMEGMRALASVTIADDRGARYALRGGGSSGKRGAPDRFVRLRVVPVPGREIGWIEMQGPDGTTTRLLPTPRAAARTGQVGPARVTAAERPGMPGAAPRAEGLRLYRDIGVALPAVDGVSIHLDSLISLPGSWLLYLRARPRWRNYGRAGQREKDPVLGVRRRRPRRQLPGQLRQEHRSSQRRRTRRGTPHGTRGARPAVPAPPGPARPSPQADTPGSTRGDHGRPRDRDNPSGRGPYRMTIPEAPVNVQPQPRRSGASARGRLPCRAPSDRR